MKIKDITPNSKDVELVAKCVNVSAPREVNTKYGVSQVASATLEDETGTIALTLWGKQISQVTAGVSLKITNGYVREYQNQMQLNVGNNGSLQVVV